MAKDDESHALLYTAIGALAAVGAGYLAWRYLLSDETKVRAKKLALRAVNQATVVADEAITTGRQVARTAAVRASETVDAGRDSARGIVNRIK